MLHCLNGAAFDIDARFPSLQMRFDVAWLTYAISTICLEIESPGISSALGILPFEDYLIPWQRVSYV